MLPVFCIEKEFTVKNPLFSKKTDVSALSQHFVQFLQTEAPDALALAKLETHKSTVDAFGTNTHCSPLN